MSAARTGLRALVLGLCGAALLIAPAAASKPPEEVGRWTTEPFELPTYAINTVMLPTGKVLFYSYPSPHDGERPNAGRAALWDPSRGFGARSFTKVAPPRIDVDGDGDTEPTPIFCSGQSFLSDGRVLITGGNLEPDGITGLKTAFVFDPFSETWARQEDMRRGRWYPSQVLLPDRRTMILGGFTDDKPAAVVNTDLETFEPGTHDHPGTFHHHPSGDRRTGLYPHLFVIPGGDVLLAGPGSQDSGVLDTDSFTWTNPNPGDPTLPSRARVGGAAVIEPSRGRRLTRVTQIGGFGGSGPNKPATASTESIDLADPEPRWAPSADLNVPRSEANTVTLPDGSLVTVGGANGVTEDDGRSSVHPDGRGRRVELMDGGGEEWRLGPAQEEDRGYHSTAVLLPDGRIFSGGDEQHPTRRTDTAELYSPPYLFRGRRPKVLSAPKSVRWGDEFGIGTKRDDIREVALVAPGATTHAADMNQRRVPLKLTDRVPGKGVNVRAPAGADLALPGYYMLFALDRDGVPSVARWVRLREGAGNQPELR